jgi:outer membrane protein OmpA-like peptidoglycan-associated protein/tetratricopeptide (TPR) repeat protein
MLLRPLLLLFFYLTLTLTNTLQAQLSKEVKKVIAEANENFFHEKYSEVLDLYSSIEQQVDTIPEVNFQRGICYYVFEDNVKAVLLLEKALNTGIKHKQLFYVLGHIYHNSYRFPEAVKCFEKYQDFLKPEETSLNDEAILLIDRSKMAKEMVENPVDSIRIKNLGSAVNSKYDDFSPVISMDELVMIFTSRRENTTGGEKDETGEYYEDVYMSYKLDTSWSKATNIRNINTESHDACLAISANAEELILYRATPQNHGDLYVSYLKGEKWSEPESLGNKINTSFWETSATISGDGSVIFFSSNRKGGYGGRDIYIALRQKNGVFGTPYLLGPDINTPDDEDCPFLHADGKTLYFSSNGPKSMGGFDIFYCTINTSTGDVISDVVNIGYPINTTSDDVFFVWSADNKRAYFSSEREGGHGKKDIYLLERNHAKAQVLVMKGKVFDKRSSKPMLAEIIVTDLSGKKEIGRFHSNSVSGKYTIALNEGDSYKLFYSSVGYDTIILNLNLDSENEYRESIKDIYLTPRLRKVNFEIVDASKKKLLSAKIRVMDLATGNHINVEGDGRDGRYSVNMNEGNIYNIEINKVGFLMKEETYKVSAGQDSLLNVSFELQPAKKGNTMVLNSIYFSSGSNKPMLSSMEEIDKILDFMEENPSVELQILAHTDEIGSAQYNLQLSQKRAEYILTYLVSKGIAKTRLSAKGYGESKPVKQTEEETNHALNRRVEFTIVKIE